MRLSGTVLGTICSLCSVILLYVLMFIPDIKDSLTKPVIMFFVAFAIIVVCGYGIGSLLGSEEIKKKPKGNMDELVK